MHRDCDCMWRKSTTNSSFGWTLSNLLSTGFILNYLLCEATKSMFVPCLLRFSCVLPFFGSHRFPTSLLWTQIACSTFQSRCRESRWSGTRLPGVALWVTVGRVVLLNHSPTLRAPQRFAAIKAVIKRSFVYVGTTKHTDKVINTPLEAQTFLHIPFFT